MPDQWEVSDSNMSNSWPSRTMDPDTASAAAWVWTTNDSRSKQATQALVAACPLSTNKITGCGPDPRLLYNLWWQHGSQAPAVVGLWTQIWTSAAAWAWKTPWLWVVRQGTQIGIAPAAVRPSDTNTAPCGRPDPRNPQSHGHQNRPWL